MARIIPRKSQLRDGTEILIRCAEQSDARMLLDAVMTMLRDGDGMVMDPDEFSQSEEQEQSWGASFNDNPRDRLLVAEAEGRLVGGINFHVGKRRRFAHTGEFGLS